MKTRRFRSHSAPFALNHVVEALNLRIALSDGDDAHALGERIAELNRSRFVPLIGRILDEFDRPHELVRIGRIELDLGRFAEHELDEAEARLEAALREALSKALAGGGDAAETVAAAADPFAPGPRQLGEALVELLEHWLLHGVWPYGSALAAETAPSDVVDRLIVEAPAALVAMLRRRGRTAAVARRLVEQLPEPVLERLLGRVEPRDAHAILAYMAETRAAHAAEPVGPESEESFSRTLWTVVLRDSLERAGLRANRRALVAGLVARLAEAQSLSFDDLLAALSRGLAAVPGAGQGADSLLSILAEIGGTSADMEGGSSDRAAEPDFAAAAERLARPAAIAAGEREAVRAALLAFPSEARRLLQRLAAAGGAPLPLRLEGVLSAAELDSLLAASPAQRERSAFRLDGVASGTGRQLLALPDRAPRPDAPASGALSRLEDLLEDAVDGAPLEGALAAAMAAEPVAARRLLRRMAAADPDGLAATIGAARLLALILPRETGEAMAALAATIAAEQAPALVAAAAELPVSAPPALVMARAVERVAERRGEAPRATRVALAAEAKAAGGAAARGLAAQLDRLETGERQTLRRLRGLDLVRALLAGATAATPEPGIRGPAALPLALLRAELGGATQERLGEALARLDAPLLQRLALALAPDSSARAALRARLRAGADAELAAVVAALLASGKLPAEPVRQVAAAGLDPLLALLTDATGDSGDDAAAAAILLAALPAEERSEAEALAGLFGGPGRGLVPRGKLARALARAASRVGARRTFEQAWLDALFEAASLAERAALTRLLDAHRAGGRLRVPAGGGRAAAAAEEPAEHGSAAWALWLLERRPPGWRKRVAEALRSPKLRARLAARLPRALLGRLAAAAAPNEAASLIAAAALAAQAAQVANVPLAAATLWEALLAAAATSASRPGRGLAALLASLIERHPRPAAFESALSAAAPRGSVLAAALAERRHDRRRAARAAPAPPARDEPRGTVAEPADLRVAIANAGLVLAAPFLPHLFDRLGLTAPNESGRPAFVSRDAQGRALHLVQWLADRRCDRPEPVLALNKLLCGQPLAAPAPRSIEPLEEELAQCAALLEAMRAHWPQMATSSIDAMSGTFLIRDGRLARSESGWTLTVERKLLDVLLDGVGWSYSLILLPWMPEPLSVAW